MGMLEASWTTDIGDNNTKLFDYLDNKKGEASYQFYTETLEEEDNETDNFKVVISLKDPEYNDLKVAILIIEAPYSSYNQSSGYL
jgi:hypothetical protein